MASGALQRPIVGGTGSESLSVIMARAQQQATAQSAQILSAANNIARQRERAGQAAESAAFRLRMEGFQRMEFDQKKKIEDARLSISQDANQRAEQLQPLTVKGMGLDNELKRLDVQMGPLKRQEMRARIERGSLQNQALRADNEFNQWSKPHRQAVVEAQGSSAEIEVRQNEEVLADKDRAGQDLNSIFDLVGSEEYQRAVPAAEVLSRIPFTGGALAAGESIRLTGEKMAAALEELKNARGSQVGKDPDVTESYNAALDEIPGLSEERKAQLTANPPEASLPLREGESRTTTVRDRQGNVTQTTRRGSDSLGRLSSTEVSRRINIVQDAANTEKETRERSKATLKLKLTYLKKQLENAKKDERDNFRDAIDDTQTTINNLDAELDTIDQRSSSEIEAIKQAGRAEKRIGLQMPATPAQADPTLIPNFIDSVVTAKP